LVLQSNILFTAKKELPIKKRRGYPLCSETWWRIILWGCFSVCGNCQLYLKREHFKSEEIYFFKKYPCNIIGVFSVAIKTSWRSTANGSAYNVTMVHFVIVYVYISSYSGSKQPTCGSFKLEKYN